jgi:hypothetical protein
MKKDDIIAIFSIACCTIVFLIFLVLPNKNYPTKYEKVRIDSVSSKLKYEVMTEKIWTYHTKHGPFTRTKQYYQVGDSVVVEIVDMRKK